MSPLAKVIIDDEALIWARVKKILQKKGANAAIKALREIRAEQALEKALSLKEAI